MRFGNIDNFLIGILRNKETGRVVRSVDNDSFCIWFDRFLEEFNI